MSNFEKARIGMQNWEHYLRANLTVGAPTDAMIEAHQHAQEEIMKVTHKLDRGLFELAIELDTNKKTLEEMLVGKSVLDIGCGTGKLASEITKIKRTRVVALDHNPEVLSRVPKMKNLSVVEGSGFDLKQAVADEQFDFVISSFSSILWARTEQEKVSSITSAIGATIAGGTTLLVPVVSNPSYRLAKTTEVTNDVMSENSALNPYDALDMLGQLYTAGWYDIAMFDTIHSLESSGQVDLKFVASRANRAQDPLQERYSAIVAKV